MLGPDGKGVDGLRVRVGGVDADPCRAGCYRATIPLPPGSIDVALEGKGAKPATLRFELPARWPAPDATALVTKVDHAFRALRTVVIHEHLASSSRNAIDTVYRLEAPNRMTYDIAGGPDAIVIGEDPLGPRLEHGAVGALASRSRFASPSPSGDPTRAGTRACSGSGRPRRPSTTRSSRRGSS